MHYNHSKKIRKKVQLDLKDDHKIMLKDDHKIILNKQDEHFLNLCTTIPNFIVILVVRIALYAYTDIITAIPRQTSVWD